MNESRSFASWAHKTTIDQLPTALLRVERDGTRDNTGHMTIELDLEVFYSLEEATRARIQSGFRDTGALEPQLALPVSELLTWTLPGIEVPFRVLR